MNYPSGAAYIEGQFVPMSEAKISVLDWGFLRSDVTYDVVSTWNHHFFRLEDHLDRFYRSAEKLRLAIPHDRETLTRILAECARRSGHANAYVEMIITRGVSPTFSRDPRDAENTFIAFAIELGHILTPEKRREGLHLAVADTPRISPDAVDPTVKNYHWLDLVMGLYEAYDRGAKNVVLTDGNGHVVEGPGFNLFVIKDGRAATPDRGVLHGITRMTAIDLLKERGTPIEIRGVSVTELREADEAFITSTAGGIMAVSRVDDRTLSNGAPGPLTDALDAAYWQAHERPEWSLALSDVPTFRDT